MPNSQIHRYLTRGALDLVPIETGDNTRLSEEYCTYPDDYFSSPEQLEKYIFVHEGIPFHYLPDTPVNPLYRYWSMENGCHRCVPYVNRNFLHARAGFIHYLSRSFHCLAAGESEEGRKYAGCLLHVLQDALFGAHALEGAGGSDLFIPGRMFDCTENLTEMLMQLSCLDCTLPDYAPAPLGATPEEAAMRLYAEYCRKSADSRKCCYGLILNRLNQCRNQDRLLIQRMYENAVTVCADVLYTMFLYAAGMPPEPAACRLEELEPYEFPLGGFAAYRARTFERDRAIAPDGKAVPLELRTEKGRQVFAHGISFGSHLEGNLEYWIAPGIFSEFSCLVGLYPLCPGTGEVAMDILNDGQPVESIRLVPDGKAVPVSFSQPRGALGFRFRSTPTCGIIVIADARLA